VEGISRFLSKVYRFVARNAKPDDPAWNETASGQPAAARKMQRKLHQTIHRITEDFAGRWHFNTSISALMELVNELYAYEDDANRNLAQAAPLALVADAQRKLVLMLAPFAPYLAHELWEKLGETSDLLRAPWPQYDPALAKEEEVEIGIQVNGKIRSRIVVPAEATDDEVREQALADEKVKAAISGKEIVKVLVVKGRLVNIAVK
jgi:leucyl-tRNA synthetase